MNKIFEWPILMADGSISWLSWVEMKRHIGTPGNSFDEVQKRLSALKSERG
jgi:hypothetical protein